MLRRFSCVQLFVTLWTAPCQAPLSIGFSRQEYWSELPCPLPGESSQPRDRTQVSFIAGRFFTDWATSHLYHSLKKKKEKKKLLLWKTSAYVKVRDHWTPINHNPALTVTSFWSTLFHLYFYTPLAYPGSYWSKSQTLYHFIISFVNISEWISES